MSKVCTFCLRWLLVVVVIVGVFCTNLLASTVGTFDIADTVTITRNNIKWTNDVSPSSANKSLIGPGPTGIYSALGGTTATIDDVTRSKEPVGTSFTQQPFLFFDAAPSLSPLLINSIFVGIYSPGGCDSSEPAERENCRSSRHGAAPLFNFLNDPPLERRSSITWSLEGVSADGRDTWFGNFTSQFPDSFQQVLTSLARGGSGEVTESYSATITVSENATPVAEPGVAVSVGFGLIAVAVFLRRRYPKR